MRRFTLAQPALLDPPGGDRIPETPDAARACAPRPGQGDVHLLSGAGIGDASHLGERREVVRRPERRRWGRPELIGRRQDRKSTRLNSSHVRISYAVFCLKKKKKQSHRKWLTYM